MFREKISIKRGNLIAVLVILAIIVNLQSGQEPCPVRYYGKPIITDEYQVLAEQSIEQIASDDRYVYILYGSRQGNVQVFDLDGIYQYSAYFYDNINGAFAIAAEDGVLYVQDCRHNLYQLKDGQFLAFTERDEAGELLDQIDFSRRSDTYVVKFGSVYRVEEGQEICVIQRPWRTALHQGNMMFFVTLFVVLGIGIARYKKLV